MTSVPVACEIFRIAPSGAYPKIRADLADGGNRFPVRVLQYGRVYRVPVPAILAALGASTPDIGTGTDPASALSPANPANPADPSGSTDLLRRPQSRVDQPGRNPRYPLDPE
ncbi:hypothetical protein [Cryptosporangium phraense]|uniref:hypothetical protein n=1 Tax=Cryptosporangium phraense TaxID=2593070 RepID=UPI00197AE4A8|nr:hypothetical protein [Cryptosporangium phraense]